MTEIAEKKNLFRFTVRLESVSLLDTGMYNKTNNWMSSDSSESVQI